MTVKLDNVEDVYELTSIQEGMLFHSIADKDSGVFVNQVCWCIHGDLDISRFKSVWESVIARHECLRTAVVWKGLDEPLQVVREKVDLPWREVDWSSTDESEIDIKFTEYLITDRKNVLDLAEAPLFRLAIIRLADKSWRFVWTSHHIVLDGWSVQLIVRELFDRYAGNCVNKVIDQQQPIKFKEFVSYLKNQPLDEAESYWKESLAGFEKLNQLIDYEVTASTSDISRAQREISLDSETYESLAEYAKKNRLTQSSVICGAWARLVSAYSGLNDVVFGVTGSGRSPELAGVENSVGMFINTLPLRAKVDNSDLTCWLQGIQQQQLKLREYEYTPLSLVQRLSDMEPGQSLFETIVVFENYPNVLDQELSDSLARVGTEIGDFTFVEKSNYKLALLVIPSETLQFQLIYSPEHYSTSYIDNLLKHFTQVLSSFLQSRKISISDHLITSKAERQLLLEQHNNTSVEFEQTIPIHRIIQRRCDTEPNNTAIIFENKKVTYSELLSRSKQLSTSLINSGVRKGDYIGLYSDRSDEMVIGILGILLTGAAYVPLDPTYPAHHIQFVVEDLDLSVVVAQKEHLQQGSTVFEGTVMLVSIDHMLPVEDVDRSDLSDNSADLNSPAYVIYTSGSQGQPKGVAVTHNNLLNSTLARTLFYKEAVDNFLLLSSMSFDSAVVGLFWTLSEGGTLVLPRQGDEQSLEIISELINDTQVTHTLCLPSLYNLLLAHTNSSRLQCLKTVIVAGEPCSEAIIKNHRFTLPGTRLFNEYGPTESTVWCTAYDTANYTSGIVPIGQPIANTKAYILDDDLVPVPTGHVGELHIAGTNVTTGYLGSNELTVERFIKNPHDNNEYNILYKTGDSVFRSKDGEIVFLGRRDEQIKIRGHRVELTEIESVLSDHDDIEAAVVTYDFLSEDVNQELIFDSSAISNKLESMDPNLVAQLFIQVSELTEDELLRSLEQ